MKRVLLLLALLLIAGIAFWRYASYKTSGQTSSSGASAPGMPAVVNASLQDLLQALEVELDRNQPDIQAKLYPGITPEALQQAQADLSSPLHPELQALYRWHNGAPAGAGLLPSYDFYSLEQAIDMNHELAAGLKHNGLGWLLAGEASWLYLFPDPAGDGYYYDPARDYASGGVFFNFREVGYFVRFPSLRNLLAAIIDCYRQGAYQGTQTVDFDLEQKIMSTYGLESQP